MKQTTEKDNYIGRRLDGRYLVEELIGVGGMAYVYKATDLKDNSTVAVKILKEELTSNEELVRRFKNESRAISMLDHENIVKVLDVNFSDSVQYIVMEYLNGITLKEYIQAHTTLTWKETVYFAEQLLRALQHAHDRGIIHRDMKPQNVMLLRSGKIKVTDFGIARFSRSGMHTITDKAIGTVHYISPEQAKGEETNTQSDLYSVGVMMYEMCTGKLPFDSDSAVTVALKQISDTPVRPREINPGVPEGLEDIIMKAMEKDTEKRYQSAGSMLKDIDEFKNNPSVRFEYKYLSSDNPTVYLDHARAIEEESEEPIEEIKESPMAKEKKPLRGAAIKAKENATPKVKKKRPHTINLPIAILMGLTAACLIGAGILVYMTLNLSGSQIFANHYDVDLPNFVGQTVRTVQSDINNEGFQFEIVEEYNTDYKSGVVFSQTPVPPKEVKDNAKITLYVSKGTQIVTVPDIVGETYGNAVKALQELGLVVIRETDNTNEFNGNTITKVEPDAGSSVESGTQVTIYVNTPNRVNSQYVPNVVGMSLGKAKGALQANGLRVGGITEVPAAEPAGTVLGQSIGAGARVSTGSYIALTVSAGNPEVTQTFAVSLPYSDKNGNKNFNFEFKIGDAVVGAGAGSSLGSASFTKAGTTDEGVAVFLNGVKYMDIVVSYQTGAVTVNSTNTNDFVMTEPQVCNHVWDKGVETKKPTETAEGEKTYTCTKCGQKRTEPIPKLNHTHTLQKFDETNSSCTVAGYYAYYKCTSCGKMFSDQGGKKEISAIQYKPLASHTPIHVDAHDPTCTSTGNIDYFKCSVCGKCFSTVYCDPSQEISESSTVLPATDHIWEDTGNKPTGANCIHYGTKEQRCRNCGALRNVDDLDAPPTGIHNFVDGVCTVCNAQEPGGDSGGGGENGEG